MKTSLMTTVIATLVLTAVSASAQSESMSMNQSKETFEKSKETSNISATSKAQALHTDSVYFSMPREDMTYTEFGAFTQKQKFNTDIKNSEANRSNSADNKAFYFEHSRGLMENLAVDFNLDYFMKDEAAFRNSSGVNKAMIGLRSYFEAMDVKWIYGGALTYLPDGESNDNSSKLAVSAKIGFEEAVDIARWGAEIAASTQDNVYFQNSLNLVGFFEMPFVKSVDFGVTAGADITRISASEQANFVKAYGQYNIDAVSAAQIHLQQNNTKKDSLSMTESEAGLALTRVF